MKTRIPVVLALAAALALAACAPAQTADAPQNEQTAETAQNAGTASAQETAALPAVAGELYALAEDGAQTCLFNAGDCGYQMLWQNDHRHRLRRRRAARAVQRAGLRSCVRGLPGVLPRHPAPL